ncbi:hypothetical protein GCK72_022901 [Caenorhabditis remanei]|uniref:HMG box domain-containing protein n=1 Tax=Caenorhabditis remanei TaxID=31234 RepID=A0A6A5FVB1_CAERE|nr:hypothetical protein GCK72_022901 [Caenorhabditis remanei]KAF1746445.1 hypothetical protein GCK72_022901 [Caenorhabditis remanei]
MSTIPDFHELSKTQYMLFRDAKHPQLAEQYPDSTDEELVELVASFWEKATPEKKAFYSSEAARLKALQKKFYGHLKRPRSAYTIWSNENCIDLFNQNPTANARVITKKLGIMWNDMSDEEKTPYFQQEEMEKAVFEAAVESIKNNNKTEEKQPIKGPKTSYNIFYSFKKNELEKENLSIEKAKMAEEINKTWRNMSDAEKAPFRVQAMQLKIENNKISANQNYQSLRMARKRKADVANQEAITLSPSLSTDSEVEREDNQTPSVRLLECSFSNLGIDDGELEQLENIEPTVKMPDDFPWEKVIESIL